MRILFVSYFYEYNFGGAEIIARTLKELIETELQHQVDVACFAGGPAPQTGHILPIKRLFGLSDQTFKRAILFLNNRLVDEMIFRGFQLSRIAKTYDLVHCHDFNAARVSYRLSKSLGVPLVISLYDNLPRRLNPGQTYPLVTQLLNWLVARRATGTVPVLAFSSGVVCISNHTQNTVEKFFQRHKASRPRLLTTIYPPAEKYFYQARVETARPPPVKGTVLYLGRLSKEKGLDLVLASLRQITEPIQLSILGIDGPLADEVQRLAREQPNIRILKPVPHHAVKPIMHEHDVICCPSIYEEPFGKTVFEARALGKKVVTTAQGGIAEIIDGYPKTFVVEIAGQSRSAIISGLAAKITAAIQAQDYVFSAEEQQAEQAFLRRFSPEVIMGEYQKLYTGIFEFNGSAP